MRFAARMSAAVSGAATTLVALCDTYGLSCSSHEVKRHVRGEGGLA